jgi:hypothetical protein
MAHRQVINRDSWQQILASAVSIFDDLKSRKLDLPYLVLGGGTVLMFRFEHRLSRDVDFFMRDVQWLGYITPRLNDVVAAMVEGYEEQANSLKLVLPAGDIDFVAASTVTNFEPIEMLEFRNYSFPLETTEEKTPRSAARVGGLNRDEACSTFQDGFYHEASIDQRPHCQAAGRVTAGRS